MTLSKKHPHPRDKNVALSPDYDLSHIYLINGQSHVDQGYNSVTTFIKKFFHPFDPDEVLEKYYEKWQREEHDTYFNLTHEQIKNIWELAGTESAELGTYLHAQIEKFLNGDEYDHVHEMDNFKEWLEETGLTPFRTEMTIYSEELKLVGNVDLLAIDKNGQFVIVDFKRTLPAKTSAFGKKCKGGLNLPHTDESKHILQLNIYRHILETEYGFRIGGLYNLYIIDSLCEMRKRPKMNLSTILPKKS